MKKNTQLLLLSHYFPATLEEELGYRNYGVLYDLFSLVTQEGIRTSMSQLVKKGYIQRFSLNNQSVFALSLAGRTKLQLLFPGLYVRESKKSKNQGFLFLINPSALNSAQLPKLRHLMSSRGLLRINTTTYLFPGPDVSDRLIEHLIETFPRAVSVAEVKEFSLKSFELNLNGQAAAKKSEDLLSGLITDMESLLKNSAVKKEPSEKVKGMIYSSFWQFADKVSDQLNSPQSSSRSSQLIQAYFSALSRAIFTAYFSRKQ